MTSVLSIDTAFIIRHRRREGRGILGQGKAGVIRNRSDRKKVENESLNFFRLFNPALPFVADLIALSFPDYALRCHKGP